MISNEARYTVRHLLGEPVQVDYTGLDAEGAKLLVDIARHVIPDNK